MKQVNIHEANTHLSRLVEEAARGEGFIIATAGKPMVKVVALDPAPAHDVVAARLKVLGALEGRWRIPADIDRFAEDEVLDIFGLM